MKCEHNNRKNDSSNKGPGYNFVRVICLDCGAFRYETRRTDSKAIETGRWINGETNKFIK